MALNSASLEKTGAWYGILNGICMIAYALLLQLINAIEIPLLRFGFIFISVIFICFSIASLKKGRAGKLDYLQGIGVGAITAIVSSFMFAVFTILNVEYFNSRIVDVLRSENVLSEHLSVSLVFMVIMIIGSVGGTITAFIAMQYFKRADHKLNK